MNISDVRDEHSLRYLVRDQDVLFNLAGQTSHLDSMTDPYTDLEINCAQPALDPRGLPAREPRRSRSSSRARARSTAARSTCRSTRATRSRPVDVNGINKAAGEWYHLLYGDVYGIRASVLRLTNTYGPRMRVRDARQTFLGIWIRHALAGEEILDLRRRQPAARPHLRRRRGRRLPARGHAGGGRGPGLQPRRRRPRVAARARRDADPDRGQRPDPARPVPRRTARRSTSATTTPTTRRSRASSAGSPAVGLEEGLARTLEYYREHGDAYWGGRVKVPFLDLTRETASLRDELDAAIARRARQRPLHPLGRGRPLRGGVRGSLRRLARRRGRVGHRRDHDRAARGRRRPRRRGDHGARTRASRRSSGSSAPARRRCSPTSTRRRYTLDPADVERRLTPRTKAILPVHLYGQPADLEALLAAAASARVVEDCAQAHGATVGGRPAGSLGDAAAFSFYPTKNLGALGDGGAVVTQSDEIADRARLLRNYGERERYEHVLRGLNSRLDPIQAAVLSVKLGHLARERRAAAAARGALRRGAGRHAARRLPRSSPAATMPTTSTSSSLPTAIGSGPNLDEAGIGTAVHYPTPMHRQPAYRELDVPGGFPVAESPLRASREPAALGDPHRRGDQRRGRGGRRDSQPRDPIAGRVTASPRADAPPAVRRRPRDRVGPARAPAPAHPSRRRRRAPRTRPSRISSLRSGTTKPPPLGPRPGISDCSVTTTGVPQAAASSAATEVSSQCRGVRQKTSASP